MARKPFFSILIPVYNSSNWLLECLNSVVKATKKLVNFSFVDGECHDGEKLVEMICVDDGSSDDSGSILDKFREQLENTGISIGDVPVKMHVVHQQNSGVSFARNVAIEQAKGEWFIFLDSDDWIGENYLIDSWKAIQRDSNLDLLATTVERVIDGEKYVNAREGITRRLFEGDLLAETYRNEYMSLRSSFCDLVIRGDVLRKHSIRFHEIMKREEDSLFAETLFAYSEKMLFGPEIKSYFYRRESNQSSLFKPIYLNDIKACMFRVQKNIRLFRELATKGTRLNASHCALGIIFEVNKISPKEQDRYLSWLIGNYDFKKEVLPFLCKYGTTYKSRSLAWMLRLFPKLLCIPILRLITKK